MGDTNDPPVEQSQEIKKGWRPEGWVNPYDTMGLVAKPKGAGLDTTNLMSSVAFEAGADDMLEALCEMGMLHYDTSKTTTEGIPPEGEN